MIDGNGTETGHIIVTTINGRNGQPKQVKILSEYKRNLEDKRYFVLIQMYIIFMEV